jgi:hypothetical protein
MNTRSVSAVLALAVLVSACGSGGRPARLVIGNADTVIVNSRKATLVPSFFYDAEGKLAYSSRPTRYKWLSGDSLRLTAAGELTCERSGNAKVEASAGELTATAMIHCRPVKSIKISGPLQFLVGDTAQRLATEVLGMDGQPVDLVTGSVSIDDRSVAGAVGMKISPRAPGGTAVTVTVGDESAMTSVHVYQALDAIRDLKPEQMFVGVPLSLRSGELRKWELPPGEWMYTMMPYEDARTGLKLVVVGAKCVPNDLTPRRITCTSKSNSSVTVSHPSKVRAPELTGRLLVRRIAS